MIIASFPGTRAAYSVRAHARSKGVAGKNGTRSARPRAQWPCLGRRSRRPARACLFIYQSRVDVPTGHFLSLEGEAPWRGAEGSLRKWENE